MTAPTAGGLLRPPDWTSQAACQGMTSATLDPWHDDRSPYAPLARRVCAGCPVRHPCALYALGHAIGHGIWGGLDPADRRKVAARHGYDRPGIAAHGERSRYVAGCRCDLCKEAHRRYIADLTARTGGQAHGRRRTLAPLVLEQPQGRGRWTAWPGQVLLFDVRPAATAGDTGSRSIAA